MAEAPLWEYGSQPKEGVGEGFWLTSEAIIDSLPGWAEPLKFVARTIPITYINTSQFCGKQPQEYGDVGVQDLLGAVVNPFGAGDLINQLISRGERSLWDAYCEYIPAPDPILEPTPDPPPLPELEVPVDVPTPPDPPAADEDNLGLMLQMIFQMLKQLTTEVCRNQELIEWVAKQTVSLEWDFGETINVSGTGRAVCDPADGYLVTVTAVPDWLGHSASEEIVYFDAGWFSYGTLGDTLESMRLTRQAQIFWGRGFEPISVNWELNDGVQATVQALVRKPYPGANERIGFSPGG